MNYCIDPGQKLYQQVCEKLGVPCVAGFEQFDIMTNKIVVQKYMHCPECIVKYVACDGKIFLTTMSDVYDYITPDGTKVYMGTLFYFSRFYPEYIKTTNDKVINMLKSIGIKNGALSLTGFYDDGVFRFFDSSLRMGGGQDWRVACAASGVDISELLTNFAVTGSMGDLNSISKIDKAFVKKKICIAFFQRQTGNNQKN